MTRRGDAAREVLRLRQETDNKQVGQGLATITQMQQRKIDQASLHQTAKTSGKRGSMKLKWAAPKLMADSLASIIGGRVAKVLSVQRTVTLDSSWIPYLEGVTDASVGNQDVIESVSALTTAINTSGSVMLWDANNGGVA